MESNCEESIEKGGNIFINWVIKWLCIHQRSGALPWLPTTHTICTIHELFFLLPSCHFHSRSLCFVLQLLTFYDYRFLILLWLLALLLLLLQPQFDGVWRRDKIHAYLVWHKLIISVFWLIKIHLLVAIYVGLMKRLPHITIWPRDHQRRLTSFAFPLCHRLYKSSITNSLPS